MLTRPPFIHTHLLLVWSSGRNPKVALTFQSGIQLVLEVFKPVVMDFLSQLIDYKQAPFQGLVVVYPEIDWKFGGGDKCVRGLGGMTFVALLAEEEKTLTKQFHLPFEGRGLVVEQEEQISSLS